MDSGCCVFHFLLAPSYAMPIALLALELYLAWSHRAAFAPMLQARAGQGSAVTVPTSTSLFPSRDF